MKKIIVLTLLIAGFASFAMAQKPVITFEKKTHDFGTVKSTAGKVSYVFEFTNTGNADLVVSNVTTTCGCTAPDWTKAPIAPKGKGSVTVTYDAPNRIGLIDKDITVHTNAGQPEVLKIKGEVVLGEEKTLPQ